MTWWHEHPNAAALVRKHWKDAELLLIAQREPCIGIRQDELDNIQRTMTATSPDGLRQWVSRSRPRRSWFVAVLVCPGDETHELAAVAKELRLEASRFQFYLHKDAKVGSLTGWAKAGLPLDAVDEGITDWGSLHKLLGLHFNIQIVEDFATRR